MLKKLFLLFLLLTIGFLFFQNFSLNRKVVLLNQNINEKINQSRSELDQAKGNLGLLASGTNQLRLQNGLPPLPYNWGEEDATQEEPSEIDPQLEEEKKKDVFYDALTYLISVNGEYDLREAFESLFLTKEFLTWIKDTNITYLFSSTLSGTFNDSQGVILSFSIKEGGIEVSDSEGSQEYYTSSDELTRHLRDYTLLKKEISKRGDRWIALLREIPYRGDLRETIAEKQLKLKLEDQQSRYALLIRLSDYIVKEEAGVIRQSGELYLGDQTFDNWDSFELALMAYFDKLDGRTDREVRDQEIRDILTATVEESSFKDYLQVNELTLSPEIRQSEDSDYINWDFLNSQGDRMGSFALLEGFGEIYLLDGDDVVLKSFRNFTENHISLDLDSSWDGEDVGTIDDIYTSADEETFLVVGAHERNADTIILVHMNRLTNEIDMISIPRDLWFKNRKLNSVYRYYGIDSLAADISELTGLKIDKYLAIDMYAFIDVINIMGGVDVVLEESLVDPTYHIKENGGWTTLNYPAGPIHLDGLGALRVARSRHSTNDYSRSRRQQLIIGAIFDKLSAMGFSDTDKLVEFVKAGLKYTETNLSAGTMVVDLMKNSRSQLNSQNVIDATNILYESHSEIYRLPLEEQKAALANDDFYLGAWIVLPKDENYNLIKWHIREIIEDK